MIQRPFFSVFLSTLISSLLVIHAVRADDPEVKPLYLAGLMLNGVHNHFGENWVTIEASVSNPNRMGREARVAVFYAGHDDMQYARDIWIPPRASVSTWILVGPAPPLPTKPGAPFSRTSRTREIQALLYDRTDGQERLILPGGEEKTRTRLAGYRPKEPLTCILLDPTISDAELPPDAPRPIESDDAMDLVRAFRASSSRDLSDHVQTVTDSFLPPTPDAFDGVDHFVLAGRRLGNDPPGQIALRRWLERGGKLWIMLDRTDPELVRRILGGDVGFHVVDRTTLTKIQFAIHRISSPAIGPTDADTPIREFEKPVDFVRVKVGPEFTVLSSVDGWPASFTRNVGLGKLIVTTLGARGWCRPRDSTDGKSKFENFPDIPVTLPPMDLLSEVLLPPIEPNPLPASAWEPMVSAEIGYSVVSLRTAGLIFGGFLLVLLIVGLGLRKWGRLEVLGWVGPVAALGAGALFLILGEASRRSIPPTLGIAQIVAVNPESSDQAVTGLLGYFQPTSGPVNLNSTNAGLLDLDMGGLQGKTRRFVMTDIDQWHWEDLSLPAGVRLGTFQSVSRSDEKIAASAHFGPNGLEGKAKLSGFRGIGDALIQAPSQRAFAIQLQADGAFTANAEDLLPPGLFVAGTVLSDLQQKRQAIYSRLLTGSKIGRRSEDSLLVASGDPVEIPFTFENGIRPTGSAVFSVPLKMERTKPGEQVTIPRAFMSYKRITSVGAVQPNMEGQNAIEEEFRFQVPPSVIPLKIEKARLFAKVDAPMRRFTIKGRSAGKKFVELRSYESPSETLQIEITQEDLLSLDEQGGVRIEIAMSEPAPNGTDQPPKWTIQSLEMELIGRTLKGD
jgi:hypothetical protein